jgi:hypothetical protein
LVDIADNIFDNIFNSNFFCFIEVQYVDSSLFLMNDGSENSSNMVNRGGGQPNPQFPQNDSNNLNGLEERKADDDSEDDQSSDELSDTETNHRSLNAVVDFRNRNSFYRARNEVEDQPREGIWKIFEQ